MKRLFTILALTLMVALQANAQGTSVSNGDDRIVKLYPNPATTYITFDLQGSYKQGYSIHIYNGVLGKRMYESVNVAAKTTVNLNDFGRGIYIYHLIDPSGKIVESGKFQVSR